MLNHTKKIEEIYGDIQKQIFYMVPEKWEKICLYSSIIDMPDNVKTGELFFYYVPKGMLKKKPVNVYEIPNKFNLDESEYLKLVELLYDKIKELREEFRNIEQETWSNITIIIQNSKARVEYDYERLENSDFTSYERHIIWRYKYLGIGPEQVSKSDKEILRRYIIGAKSLHRTELYEFDIYVEDVKNIVDYNTKQEPVEQYETEPYENEEDEKDEYEEEHKNQNINRNQILLSQEQIEKMKLNKE